jgi:YVTN family beta-propeller protein
MRNLLAALLLVAALPSRADLLLVANRGGSTITVIDPATMTVVGTAPVGADPHEIAVSADGRLAYVSNYGGSNGTTLSVIDIATRKKVKDVSIAPLVGPHGIVFAQGKVWFTAERSGAVGRYDPVADRVDWIGRTNQNGTHMLVVRPDASTVYTANVGSATSSIISVTAADEDAARKHIGAVPASEGIALSPDRRELWIGSVSTGGIAIIDLESEQVVQTISQGKPAYRLTFTNDGKFVLVPRQAGVAVYDAATRAELRTLPVGGPPLSVLVAADNRIAYVATVNPHRVVKLDLETGAILGFANVAPVPDGLAWAAVPRAKRRASRVAL